MSSNARVYNRLNRAPPSRQAAEAAAPLPPQAAESSAPPPQMEELPHAASQEQLDVPSSSSPSSAAVSDPEQRPPAMEPIPVALPSDSSSPSSSSLSSAAAASSPESSSLSAVSAAAPPPEDPLQRMEASAHALREAGQLSEARSLLENCHAQLRERFTADSPRTMATALELGRLLLELRMSERAEVVLSEMVDSCLRVYGPGADNVVTATLELERARRMKAEEWLAVSKLQYEESEQSIVLLTKERRQLEMEISDLRQQLAEKTQPAALGDHPEHVSDDDSPADANVRREVRAKLDHLMPSKALHKLGDPDAVVVNPGDLTGQDFTADIYPELDALFKLDVTPLHPGACAEATRQHAAVAATEVRGLPKEAQRRVAIIAGAKPVTPQAKQAVILLRKQLTRLIKEVALVAVRLRDLASADAALDIALAEAASADGEPEVRRDPLQEAAIKAGQTRIDAQLVAWRSSSEDTQLCDSQKLEDGNIVLRRTWTALSDECQTLTEQIDDWKAEARGNLRLVRSNAEEALRQNGIEREELRKQLHAKAVAADELRSCLADIAREELEFGKLTQRLEARTSALALLRDQILSWAPFQLVRGREIASRNIREWETEELERDRRLEVADTLTQKLLQELEVKVQRYLYHKSETETIRSKNARMVTARLNAAIDHEALNLADGYRRDAGDRVTEWRCKILDIWQRYYHKSDAEATAEYHAVVWRAVNSAGGSPLNEEDMNYLGLPEDSKSYVPAFDAESVAPRSSKERADAKRKIVGLLNDPNCLPQPPAGVKHQEGVGLVIDFTLPDYSDSAEVMEEYTEVLRSVMICRLAFEQFFEVVPQYEINSGSATVTVPGVPTADALVAVSEQHAELRQSFTRAASHDRLGELVRSIMPHSVVSPSPSLERSMSSSSTSSSSQPFRWSGGGSSAAAAAVASSVEEDVPASVFNGRSSTSPASSAAGSVAQPTHSPVRATTSPTTSTTSPASSGAAPSGSSVSPRVGHGFLAEQRQ